MEDFAWYNMLMRADIKPISRAALIVFVRRKRAKDISVLCLAIVNLAKQGGNETSRKAKKFNRIIETFSNHAEW